METQRRQSVETQRRQSVETQRRQSVETQRRQNVETQRRQSHVDNRYALFAQVQSPLTARIIVKLLVVFHPCLAAHVQSSELSIVFVSRSMRPIEIREATLAQEYSWISCAYIYSCPYHEMNKTHGRQVPRFSTSTSCRLTACER